MEQITVWAALSAITVAVCVLISLAVRKPMRDMLGANKHILPARGFYLRSFSVLLLLGAFAMIFKTDVPAEGKAFMEYVWWIADSLQPVFFVLSIWVIVYVALLTILFAVLGKYND
jgi:uncharacterized membrane protein YozB (DUF420 family)